MSDAKKRTTAKDVLRIALQWKHRFDQTNGSPTASSGELTFKLYQAIADYENGAALDRIEKEVFDDPVTE